jgi:hypothetical protein
MSADKAMVTDAIEAGAKAAYEYWSNYPACTASDPWEVRKEKLPGSAHFFRELTLRISAALAQAEQPVAYRWTTPAHMEQRTFYGPHYPVGADNITPLYAHPPAKREAGETAAPDTPAPQSHLRGEPVAWRVTRYDNKGAWVDTTLHIRKPEIASTSRTDIEPLYLGQEASTND